MKIAYLGQMADVSTENGISKKIRAQAAHWLLAGHEVRYFSLSPSTRAWSGLEPLRAELVERGGFVLRVLRSCNLTRQIKAWAPDVIYFRYAYHSAGLPGLFRNIPTIAEINSDDLAEYPLTLSAAKLAYHRVTRSRLLNTVAGFVPVTHELGARFASFGKPTEVIANGIDFLNLVPYVPPTSAETKRLIFVGSAGSPWHGLERVMELAQILPDVRIDIVGCIAPAGPRAPTLRFHGPLPRKNYEPLLAGATAAIGTMALFRKNMEEACPLKVREYLSLGVPVIGAYRDTDIPDNASYFLRLPNDSAPLAPHRERITTWLDTWRGRRVSRETITHLDNDLKEKQRLEFLLRIMRHP